ncbi:MAG TPA: hypothetical protein VMV11_01265 [Acidimicrobiales bacterium]|nr:hypothetical protein [Acidimicrobiales bacterium]
MKLDVYRSCSRQEKREVLEAFWRANVHSSARIHEAALQYGPLAVLSLGAVVVELAVVIAVSLHRAPVVGWLAVALEFIVLLSLWWSLVRFRAIRGAAT